jgi:hypothetical protein
MAGMVKAQLKTSIEPDGGNKCAAGKGPCDSAIDWSGLDGRTRRNLIAKKTMARAHQKWIEWISKFQFHAMLTLTFKRPRSNVKECEEIVARLGKKLNLERAFWVFEKHEDASRGYHCHGLILFRNNPSEARFMELALSYGNPDYKPVTTTAGAVGYVTKHLADDSEFYRFPERPELWELDEMSGRPVVQPRPRIKMLATKMGFR